MLETVVPVFLIQSCSERYRGTRWIWIILSLFCRLLY